MNTNFDYIPTMMAALLGAYVIAYGVQKYLHLVNQLSTKLSDVNNRLDTLSKTLLQNTEICHKLSYEMDQNEVDVKPEVINPFVEGSLTLTHIYQIYEIKTHTIINASLSSTSRHGVFEFVNDDGTIFIGYNRGEFWIMGEEEDKTFAFDDSPYWDKTNRYVRIFKDSYL